MYNIKQKIRQHLHRLSPEDRYCRFGVSVNDEFIDSYVSSIKPTDGIFFTMNYAAKIVGFCHIAYYSLKNGTTEADFGISVDSDYRGKGYGKTLMQQAVADAQSRKVNKLYVYYLSENKKMYNMAKASGFSVMPYAEQSKGCLDVKEPTVFDIWGNVLTTNILFIDNSFKMIFNSLDSGTNPFLTVQGE